MPWKSFGKCVHKLNADGSKGELIKCHETEGEADRHIRALYANVEDSIQEFSMTILKAVTKDGELRWRSVNSDIDKDYYGERMSVELFDDFISHIENEDPFPETFKSVICEPEWCGGMPYVSLAHYKTGTGKVNVPGEIRSLYRDGKSLKSTGILYDTPLGQAVFKSMQNDFVEKREDKIRISIGFLDLEHTHGDKFTFVRKAVGEKCPLCSEGIGDKIYKKGYLVHLAFTRVPANPRTDTELLEKSMTTKLEDAKSIVEDEEVLKGLELKSQAEEEVLVVKSEDNDEDDMMKDGKKKKKMEAEHEDMHKSVSEEAPVQETPAPVAPVVELTPVQKSASSLMEKILTLKSQGVVGEAALAELQKSFDELGNVVKAEFTPPPDPTEVAKQDLANIVRSVLQEMLPQYLAQSVAPMQAEMTELRALSTAVKPTIKKEEIPQQRSLNVNLVQKAAVEKLVEKTKESQFARLARQSVGLLD